MLGCLLCFLLSLVKLRGKEGAEELVCCKFFKGVLPLRARVSRGALARSVLCS